MSAEPVMHSEILSSEEYKQSVAARIRHSEDERLKRQRSLAAGKPQLFGDSRRYIAPWWSEEKADPIYQFAKEHGIAHPVTQLGDLLEPGVKLVAVWRTCLTEEQVYARILEIEQERLKLEEPPVSQNEATVNTSEAGPTFEELPGAQRSYLMCIYDGMPVVKNAATRLALRQHGYIANSDLWDAQMLTDKGRAVVEAYLKKEPDTRLPVSAEPPATEPQTEDDQQPDHTTPVPNSPRRKYAVALLQGGYPERYAECRTMGEVYRALMDLGYMYVESMGLWVGGGKAHLQVEEGSAEHERLTRTQGAQDDMPLDEPDIDDSIRASEPSYVGDGFTEEFAEDRDEFGDHYPPVIDPDTIAVCLWDDNPPDNDDEDDAPENHMLGVGTKVVYCGDALFMPNGDFTAVPGTVGQITELLPDNQVMVAFVGRSGEVSVPLTDLRPEAEGCNKYGEPAHIQRGNLVDLHVGDRVSAGSQAGYVTKLLPGGNAEVQYVGWTEPRRVPRAGLVVIKTALAAAQENSQLEGQIERLKADNERLQQLLQQAKEQASKPAPLPNLGELDAAKAEIAALRAQIRDMQQVHVTTAGNVIPDGDLFNELRILQGRRVSKKEFQVRFNVDAATLGSLLNDGWEKFDSGFLCDESHNFYCVVFCRDLPTPQPEHTAKQHEPVRTADDVTYILPAETLNGVHAHVD